jgi:RNA polymerase sigma factor (sigma-70 family)
LAYFLHVRQRYIKNDCQPHNNMTTQQELITGCSKGNARAQWQLFDAYAPVMLGICYRYTKSMTDAEDVLQEGFVQVFRNIDQYRNEGELGAWIRRIMVNTSLNYLKRNKRYRSEMVFEETPMHPILEETPDIQLQAKELAALIRQLPTGYQTIFNLHAVEGYTHVEIAAMLGINETTSRSQYARARNLLSEWLLTQYGNRKKIYYGR